VACDIPFHLRFIYDYDLSSCVRISGDIEYDSKILDKYSTDIVINAKEFEEILPFDIPLKIFSYDIENSIETGVIYCICCAIRDGDKDIQYVDISGTEKEILETWMETIKKIDPDIIVGYNSDRYDLPHIISRAENSNLRARRARHEHGHCPSHPFLTE